MTTPNHVETTIRELEERRYNAILAGDFGIFSAIAHPDLSYAHSNGVVDSVDSYLKKCLDGFYVYHHIDHPIEKIQIHGTTALVFGEMNGEITAGGVRKQLRNKALAVWVNEADEWKLLAYQPTPIA
ncbi:nuclear transport factor 2 family protein [Pseudomonas monteilii]|jgi:hypothetical protein